MLQQLAFGQFDSLVIGPDLLSKSKEIKIAKYDVSRQSQYIIYLPMNYSKFLFTEANKQLFYQLRDTMIERIDLVYTVFKRSASFDQVQLNKERYEMLQRFFPAAFSNNIIDWNLMAQDGTMEYEKAQEYFHGFVIYLRPKRVSTKAGKIISTALDRRVDAPDTRPLETNEEVAKIKTLLEKSAATKIVFDTSYTTSRKKYGRVCTLPKALKNAKKALSIKPKVPTATKNTGFEKPKKWWLKNERYPT
jgi:5'(3')-deoxyribonucleotidase